MAKYITKIEVEADSEAEIKRIGNFLQSIVKNVTEAGIIHLLEKSSEKEIISLLQAASHRPGLVKTALEWI